MAQSIETMIANARAYADSAVSSAIYWVQKLSEIEDLVNSLTFVDGLPTWNYREISDRIFELLNIVDAEKPERPRDLGDFDIGYAPQFTPADVSTLETRLQAIIATISLIPDYANQALAIFDAANQKVLNDLFTGGYGIDTADELALWERAKDRESSNALMAIEEVKRQFATFGMPMPQGAMNASIRIAIAKAQDAKSTINRDIAIKRADLYRESRQFSIGKAIDIGNAQLGATKIKVEAMQTITATELEKLKLDVTNHKELLEAYGMDLERLVKTQNVWADIYKADVAAWGEKLAALTKAYAVMQQANSDQLAADRLTMTEGIERAKTQIAAFNAMVNVKANSAHEIANILSHKVAGALTSLNTLVAQIVEEQKLPT